MKRKENIYQIYTKLLFPQLPKKNTYLNYRHKKNHNYQIVRGFTVTLSRSRGKLQSPQRDRECYKPVAVCSSQPFPHPPPSSLSLALSVSRFEHPEKKRRKRWKEERGRRREEETTTWNLLAWVSVKSFPVAEPVVSRTTEYRDFIHSNLTHSPVNTGNRSDPRLSSRFKIFRGYCHEASYCSIEKG